MNTQDHNDKYEHYYICSDCASAHGLTFAHGIISVSYGVCPECNTPEMMLIPTDKLLAKKEKSK